jgi:hypothetical protein
MSRFIVDSEAGTVLDDDTSLIWKFPLVNAARIPYSQAVSEIPEGFRLPSQADIQSLLKAQKIDTADFNEAFPGIKLDWYWIVTPSPKPDATGSDADPLFIATYKPSVGKWASRFLWAGVLPFTRRLIKARALYVKND